MLGNAKNCKEGKKKQKETCEREKNQKSKEMCKFGATAPPSALPKKSCSQMQKILQTKEESRKKREEREKSKKNKCANSERQRHHLHYPKKVAPKCKQFYRQRKKAEKSARNAKKSKLRNKCANSERQRHYALSKKSCSEMQTILQTKEKSRKKREKREKKQKKKEMCKFREMVPPCSFSKKKSSKDFELGIGENRTTDEIQSTLL